MMDCIWLAVVLLILVALLGYWLRARLSEPASCRWRGHAWRLRFRRAFCEWVTCRVCGRDYIGDIVEGTYVRCSLDEAKEFMRGYEYGIENPGGG